MTRTDWPSLLFVGAHDRARIAKVGTRGAGAIILDLEDAVPPSKKSQARSLIGDHIAALYRQNGGIIVRINSLPDAREDLDATLCAGLDAIILPKVEDVGQVLGLRGMISERLQAKGLSNTPKLIALIESAAGLAEAQQIAAVDGIAGLALGSEDFALSMGVEPSADLLDLPCKMIALAAAGFARMALGIPLSIATIGDLEAWRNAAIRARSIGMTGVLCIHPAQITPVNAAFAPSDVELARAAKIVASWRQAGKVGVLKVGGQMVDRPVLLAARRLLARGERSS